MQLALHAVVEARNADDYTLVDAAATPACCR
jgi:hypothetical protein